MRSEAISFSLPSMLRKVGLGCVDAPMVNRWFHTLQRFSEAACSAVPTPYSTEVVLFYVARWCQKKAKTLEPRVGAFGEAMLRKTAESIARNLAADGGRVDRLLTEDSSAEWTRLRRELFASARSRVPEAAFEYAEEAMQKIAEVLLTGTPPSQAATQLAAGPEGPRNEYVFESPFSSWGRTIVINLIRDDWRRRARRFAAEAKGTRGAAPGRELIARARGALPDLLEAIRRLPPKQRSVMILSLNRRELDEAVRDRLHELAPDLFSEAGDLVSTDADIAERLGTVTRRVTANRSAARRKLARHDPTWALLLDIMLPHRSTRPLHVEPEG